MGLTVTYVYICIGGSRNFNDLHCSIKLCICEILCNNACFFIIIIHIFGTGRRTQKAQPIVSTTGILGICQQKKLKLCPEFGFSDKKSGTLLIITCRDVK